MERGPQLACVEGVLSGQSFPITVEGLRIGRDPGNEIRIDDAGVSRQHARVLLHNGAVWVQDAGSRNGIFVNGERVPDHRQVKVGDKVAVGGCTFLVTMPEASAPAIARPPSMAPRAAPPPPRAEPPARRWKIWPFVVAGLFALFIVLCMSFVGSRGDEEASSTASSPTWSLSTMLEDEAAPATPEGATPAGNAPQSVSDALAVAAGADAEAQRAKLPDPPPGVSAQELVDKAHGMYDAGRLNEARTHYRMALKLDPACEICTVRIARLETEIAESARQHFDAGMRYYDTMQLSQAIASWETVLLLVPDANDPMHVRAAEYLEKARGQAAARP